MHYRRKSHPLSPGGSRKNPQIVRCLFDVMITDFAEHVALTPQWTVSVTRSPQSRWTLGKKKGKEEKN